MQPAASDSGRQAQDPRGRPRMMVFPLRHRSYLLRRYGGT